MSLNPEALLRAGLSIVPIKTDGSKQPAVTTWKPYTERRPSMEELEGWFSGAQRGIAIVCGQISQLEVFDFDDRLAFDAWRDLVDSNRPGFLDNVPIVDSPKGVHVYLRRRKPNRNQKLARRPGPDRGKPKVGASVLIETRGEGGYIVAPGSPPECHPQKKTWTQVSGPPLAEWASQPEVSQADYELCIRAARSLNELVVPEVVVRDPAPRGPNGGKRPGDDFNERGDWIALLEQHGWTRVRGDETRSQWRRPDKAHGTSATLGYCRDDQGNPLLYVFSSNGGPLDSDRAYSLFSAFTVLEHKGDFSAAAKVLAGQGYGDPLRPKPADRQDVEAAIHEVRLAGSPGVLYESDLIDGLAVLPRGVCSQRIEQISRELGRNINVGTLRSLVDDARKKLAPPKPPAPIGPDTYRATPHGLIRLKPTRDGDAEIQLTNFSAKIVAEVRVDDGAEVEIELEIETELHGTTTRFRVAASTFASMDWVLPQLGPKAILCAGQGIRDHTRVAIQQVSEEIERQTTYAHTGWRRIEGFGWCFLHAGGPLGPEGPVISTHTALLPPLDKYKLPDPIGGSELVAKIRLTLHLLDLAPDRLTFPLFASVFRAILGDASFSLHLVGSTGVFKTMLAALFQAFFGAELHDHIPGSWSSTGNALEVMAFCAKDAIFTIDDFAPTGSSADVQRYHREAERVLRAQGNHSGRARLRPDGTRQAVRPPRGLILSTGEEVPAGQSVRARLLILPVQPGNIDPANLTERQADAQAGLYSTVTASFILWAAGQLDDLRQRFQERAQEIRSARSTEEGHRRTPTTIAELQASFEVFLEFTVAMDAISEDDSKHLLHRTTQALDDAELEHAHHVDEIEPTRLFIELISAAVSSGMAHIADSQGEPPIAHSPEALGWRRSTTGPAPGEWRPLGQRVGWIDGDDVYLQPKAAFRLAQQIASETDRLTITERTLGRRLNEKGLLLSVDVGRGKHTVRRDLQGARHYVLHLRASILQLRALRALGAQDPPQGPRNQGVEADSLGPNDIDGATSGPQLGPTDPTRPPSNDLEDALRDLLGQPEDDDSQSGEGTP